MKARLITKTPYTTWSIEVTYPEKEIPKELFKDLGEHGWESYGDNIPPIHGELELYFSKTGSGIFGMWTVKEQKSNLEEARCILEQHGLVNVPKVKLTLKDML